MAAKSEITRDTSGLERKTIKLLVWDLDNTLWKGTLLEETGCSCIPGSKTRWLRWINAESFFP
jgi:predicted enzyme involved in methoxymalonyl-ACP biosynthesis